ncbi:MAG: hypothetical protein E7291_06540 [Lachnospiraceae bacterium]|nr:hypothetical protein [Lachnospiraceae bacterium]
MALMDEFKEERAALKNGTLKEKLNYFWYYYKWHVLGTLFALFLIIFFVQQIVSRKDIVFNAVMLNASILTEEGMYAQEFAEYADIDTDKTAALFDTSYQISERGSDEASYSSAQKLMVYVTTAEVDVMITDPGSFQKYAYNESFCDLREFLTKEQLAKYEPYFYYADGKVVEEIIDAYANAEGDITLPPYPNPDKPEEMTDPIPIGIYLSSNERLLEHYYFRDGDEGTEQIVIGVYANTEHPENVLKYLEFAFSNE